MKTLSLVVLLFLYIPYAFAQLRIYKGTDPTGEGRREALAEYRQKELKCKYVLDEGKTPSNTGKIICDDGKMYLEASKYEDLSPQGQSSVNQSPRTMIKEIKTPVRQLETRPSSASRQ